MGVNREIDKDNLKDLVFTFTETYLSQLQKKCKCT